MRPQLDTDSTKHQQPQNDHQWQVKTTESRRIQQRKCEIQSSACSYQPDFIPVPDRSYGFQHDIPFFVPMSNKKADHARSKIKSVQYDIRCKHYSDENEPERCHLSPPLR